MEQQNASCVISSSLYDVAERACLSEQRVLCDAYNLPPSLEGLYTRLHTNSAFFLRPSQVTIIALEVLSKQAN